MRSAHSGPHHRCGLHNPHTRPARASRHSVSSRRRSFARDRHAPSPARGIGRSATGLRPWAACSVRSGRQPGVRHSADGRLRAWPCGTACRRSGCPPAGGGRRMYTALPPSTPFAAACRRRGRLCGSAPGRGRHIACPQRGPSHGGHGSTAVALDNRGNADVGEALIAELAADPSRAVIETPAPSGVETVCAEKTRPRVPPGFIPQILTPTTWCRCTPAASASRNQKSVRRTARHAVRSSVCRSP